MPHTIHPMNESSILVYLGKIFSARKPSNLPKDGAKFLNTDCSAVTGQPKRRGDALPPPSLMRFFSTTAILHRLLFALGDNDTAPVYPANFAHPDVVFSPAAGLSAVHSLI